MKQSEPVRDRLFTTGDVARLFHVSRPAVKKWIKAGKLRAVRTPGGHFRIPGRQLERFRKVPDDPPRVLVVDDADEVLASVVDAIHQFWPGAKVEAASDGYEALIKLGAFQPHAAVVDIRMPGLDGFEVCRRIKSNPVTAGTKLVVVSGHADPDTARRARAVGADDFFPKPLAMPALIEQLRALVEGSGARHG
jgi:excisionase family DNA binding protein